MFAGRTKAALVGIAQGLSLTSSLGFSALLLPRAATDYGLIGWADADLVELAFAAQHQTIEPGLIDVEGYGSAALFLG